MHGENFFENWQTPNSSREPIYLLSMRAKITRKQTDWLTIPIISILASVFFYFVRVPIILAMFSGIYWNNHKWFWNGMAIIPIPFNVCANQVYSINRLGRVTARGHSLNALKSVSLDNRGKIPEEVKKIHFPTLHWYFISYIFLRTILVKFSSYMWLVKKWWNLRPQNKVSHLEFWNSRFRFKDLPESGIEILKSKCCLILPSPICRIKKRPDSLKKGFD